MCLGGIFWLLSLSLGAAGAILSHAISVLHLAAVTVPTSPVAVGSCVCSVVWAHRMGPWGCGCCLWGCVLTDPPRSFLRHWSEPLSLAVGHCTHVSTGWWAFLLIHMWSSLPSTPLSLVVGSHGQMQCSYCMHIQLTCNCSSHGFGNGNVCALVSNGSSLNNCGKQVQLRTGSILPSLDKSSLTLLFCHFSSFCWRLSWMLFLTSLGPIKVKGPVNRALPVPGVK